MLVLIAAEALRSRGIPVRWRRPLLVAWGVALACNVSLLFYEIPGFDDDAADVQAQVAMIELGGERVPPTLQVRELEPPASRHIPSQAAALDQFTDEIGPLGFTLDEVRAQPEDVRLGADFVLVRSLAITAFPVPKEDIPGSTECQTFRPGDDGYTDIELQPGANFLELVRDARRSRVAAPARAVRGRRERAGRDLDARQELGLLLPDDAATEPWIGAGLGPGSRLPPHPLRPAPHVPIGQNSRPMAVCILTYDYVDDILERRRPHREAHLAHIERCTAERGLVIAGATGDPPSGALFVFEGEPDPGDRGPGVHGCRSVRRRRPRRRVADRALDGRRRAAVRLTRGCRQARPPPDPLRLRKVPVPGPMRTSTTPVRGILEAMGSATAEAPATAIAALEELAARFEPGDIDVPGGSARIRLEVTDGRDLDAVIEVPSIHLGPPAGSPDARLSADAADLGIDRGRRRRRDAGVPARAAAGSREPAPRRRLPRRDHRLDRARPAALRPDRDRRPRHRLLRGGGGAADRSACTASAAPRPRSCRRSPLWRRTATG